jgi:hypothetical protein
MDTKWLQNIEKWLNDQAEATRVTNETLNKLLAAFSAREVREHPAPPPLASLPLVTTPLKTLHPSRVNCKGNLTDLRRILHLSLAKGNPK